MFGFACNETPELMPLPIALAHRLTSRLAEARRTGALPWLRPDGKSQVTVEYDGDKPVRVDTVVVSTQHDPDVTNEQIRARRSSSRSSSPTSRPSCSTSKTIFHINPTGRFVVGGPQGDCGLTGRKIIVDTYGG